MRIGLCGAQGVGKTTLARALAKELNLPLIEEQARVAAAELGIENPRALKNNPELGIQYQWRCLELQMRAEEHTKEFVSDRTTIDNAAYWMKWHAHKVESDENLRYYDLCREQVQKYDLVVYVPIEFPPADDGFRSINQDYQKEIDLLVYMLTYGLEAKYVVEVSGSVKERLQQALAVIKNDPKKDG